MRDKFLIVFLLLSSLLIMPAYSDDWDDFSNVDRMWDGQKSITNKEFEEVMDALQANQKKKEEKQRKKLFKKIGGGGSSLHKDLNPDKEIKELQSINTKDEGSLLNIPVDIIVNNNVIERGYYKILAEKDKDGKCSVLFYQSQFLICKLEMIEVQDDFGEEKLDFAKIKPYNDSHVKFIFGSLDFNGYALIPYVK